MSARKTSSWTVFDAWTRPIREAAPPSWQSLENWGRLASSAADAEESAVSALLQAWDQKLSDLGGDPSWRPWRRFRPLRLSREEAWSDWMAHLAEDPSSSGFAYNLFPPVETIAGAVPKSHREVVLDGGTRRADLILEWAPRSFTSVELKVWDLALGKTFETAQLCEEWRPGSRWRHYVLLPQDSFEAWEEELKRGGRQMVHARSWDEVAIALRRSLWGHRGSATYLAFALAYCGAIEQRILGLGKVGDAVASAAERLRVAAARRRLLQEGRE